jgi:glycerol-3-phosphate acyltransferase PlsY
MTTLFFILSGLIGYLSGSIPFGFIYVRITTGKDLRNEGSGRTGGTNSLRAAGSAVGIFTAFSDVFKGMAGVLLTRYFFGDAFGDYLPWAEAFAGIMAVVGHNWSIFLGFKGGAGTGPNVGWAGAIWWPIMPTAFFVMLFMYVVVGMASVASMSMAAIIPVVFTLLLVLGTKGIHIAYVVGGVITGLVVLWALRPNIKRLLEGNERVVGPRAKKSE